MEALATLKPEIIALILSRIQDELTAREFYTLAAEWCRRNGYKNTKHFFSKESKHENKHYHKWIEYLSKWGVDVPCVLPVYVNPFSSLIEILERQYEMEYNLGKSYEANAIEVFPVDQFTYLKMKEFVYIQSKEITEAADLVTKARAWSKKDPDLLHFDSKFTRI